jgi:hypothetical protein
MTAKIAPCWCLLVLGIAVIAGCNGSQLERVPVSGRVLIDGKPLKFGYVRFFPEGARASGGRLDEEGRFVLTSKQKGDGVVLGTHSVAISAGESISDTQVRWHAPKKYNSPKASGLEFTISEPTDSLEILLTWDGGKPFVETRNGAR